MKTVQSGPLCIMPTSAKPIVQTQKNRRNLYSMRLRYGGSGGVRTHDQGIMSLFAN
nr:MAG TPA: hypothetical protein [Caudoviricetes sp.]